MTTKSLEINTLRKIIRLEPETGKLYWLHRGIETFTGKCPAREAGRWNTLLADKEALVTEHVRHTAYKRGTINRTFYYAHRVAWALHYGAWPTGEIDHINGDGFDNRPSNLRCVTSRENAKNRARHRSNTSGVMGVHWNERDRKWIARVSTASGRILLGKFTDKSDAIAARKAAEITAGYHENHGRERAGYV